MPTDSIGAFLNDLSKEIAIILTTLAVLHAVGAPSVFSLALLLFVATSCGVGFGYFRDSSYDLTGGVFIGILYAVSFLILGSLLIVDAVFCSFSLTAGPLVGCENVLGVYTGTAIVAGSGGFAGHLFYYR